MPTEPPRSLSLREALPVWWRIGWLSFGGPAAQIALMHRELVEERKWISNERFLHALNFCTLLPGPEAQQLATYIGWLLHRTRGGLAAGLLFVIPGAAVMFALSTAYVLFRHVPLVDAVFFGVKATVHAVVAEAVVRIGRRALATRASVLLAIAAFVALACFEVPFPLVVLSAGLLGAFGIGAQRAATAVASEETSLVDRLLEAGQLEHTRPNTPRAVRTALTWLALWVAPLGAVWAWRGRDDVLTEEGVLFSKAALVTFGGAYAVLAWVADQTVAHFGWLTAQQMADGLGLAETTPGPLILVLQFTGFFAASQHASGLEPLTAGFFGGLLTLWVTFVPCFLWIFTFAPYVEAVRSSARLRGALAAITAAVVGVIAHLSVFFALHVLFAKVGAGRAGPLVVALPEWSSIDLRAVAIGALSFLSLFAWKLGLARTLLLGATAGLLLKGVVS